MHSISFPVSSFDLSKILEPNGSYRTPFANAMSKWTGNVDKKPFQGHSNDGCMVDCYYNCDMLCTHSVQYEIPMKENWDYHNKVNVCVWYDRS